MIKPQPFKLECPKCGYSKTVRPKSDTDMFYSPICPKCSTEMQRKPLSGLDSILGKLFGK